MGGSDTQLYQSCIYFTCKHSNIHVGVIDGLVTVAKREKLPGLYRGIGPTLLAIAPFMAVQQASYDVLKHQAMMNGAQPSAMLFLISGSIAGATAQTVGSREIPVFIHVHSS